MRCRYAAGSDYPLSLSELLRLSMAPILKSLVDTHCACVDTHGNKRGRDNEKHPSRDLPVSNGAVRPSGSVIYQGLTMQSLPLIKYAIVTHCKGSSESTET
ncbi:uncharacterized protein EKO05_0004257 [Ascochyta rabiei]|uniref:uncharacterized protein n=1 Tax=Didymella rabiei TaxID=5454 RepID=UPI002209B103|nr:uncharacterized protein EKO05_0004257 [Ascochyta rabiei]UPX13758.1 hypothetical protein EKO05_0004257 [Ascochyta rabiei]